MGGRGLLALALVGTIVWLLSGFYTVGPNEVGLNRIFGRYTGKTGPGLNYNLPIPIGSVEKLQVTDRNMINIGFALRQDARAAECASPARSAGRKPDADRRRKYRRRQICRHLADRPGAPRGLCLQYLKPARNREGGGRERHARSHRPRRDPANSDRRSPKDRVGRAGTHAKAS